MRKRIAVIGLATGLTGATLLGALAMGSSAGAAEMTTSASAPVAHAANWADARDAGELDSVAGVLGLSPAEVAGRLEGGATLADLAASQGVDVNGVIYALV